MKRIFCLLILLTIAFSGYCAEIFYVDADSVAQPGSGSAEEPFALIATAVDIAVDGDIILVRPGTYNERVNFSGKAIRISGTEPLNPNVVLSTIIDGGGEYAAVTFEWGEDISSILDGVTVQNALIGVDCYYSSPTITNCVIRYNNQNGILGTSAAPTIDSCVVSENFAATDGGAIESCDGLITETVIGNNLGKGLTLCSTTMSKCVIRGNGSAGMYQCSGSIANCVISGNGGDGIEAGSGVINNCTIVGNSGDGFSSGGSAILSNNIIAYNLEYGINGESVLSFNNLWGNLSRDYNDHAPGETDTHVNPTFAADGYWDNSDKWIEGDYHLSSIAGRWNDESQAWENDDTTSQCINGGDPDAGVYYEPIPNGARVNQGAYGGTEYASRSPWGLEQFCRQYVPGDINLDCCVDIADFAILASNWLVCNLEAPDIDDDESPEPDPMTFAELPAVTGADTIAMTATEATDPSGVEYLFEWTWDDGANTSDSGWQDETYIEITGLEADIEYTFTVKARDKSLLKNETVASDAIVMVIDNTPPSPNPMAWESEPTISGERSLVMTAAEATDQYSDLEYYFTCTTDPVFDSGWQMSRTYEATGLDTDTEYAFTITAADISFLHKETDASVTATCTTLDITPPSPDPITWETVPYASSMTSIEMVAATATDEHGVEYYFVCVTNASFDSGWQDSPNYTCEGLEEAATYTFTVRARDKSITINETQTSTEASATTLSDIDPPTPDPMAWETVPHATSATSIEMIAVTATDEHGVEYYFVCVTNASFDSGWQDSTSYTCEGLEEAATYTFTVRARDKSITINETQTSPEASATTLSDIDPPTPDPMVWETPPYATASRSVTMVAATTYDDHDVEYMFVETTGNAGGTSSDWQDSTVYVDDGLTEGTSYTYTVMSRDKSINQNTSQASVAANVTTPMDLQPPTPDPLVWETLPYASGPGAMRMIATTATDEHDVEYFFYCAAGNSSGWQDSPVYEDTGLNPSTYYTYTVQVRDKSAAQNTGQASAGKGAITPAG